MEIEIRSVEQFKKETAEGKVLVDFYADWCGPCKMLAPIVAQVAEEHPELKVLKVNVDLVSDLASQYSIYSIPTLKLFEGGKVINTTMGYMQKAELLKFLGM